jgi:hypothetical protein
MFIEKYGTHAVVGVKIEGIDIIYAKQQYSSPLQPSEGHGRKKLKEKIEGHGRRIIQGPGWTK